MNHIVDVCPLTKFDRVLTRHSHLAEQLGNDSISEMN